jgi:hypothetical protein
VVGARGLTVLSFPACTNLHAEKVHPSLSRADNAAVFIQPREGRDPGNRELQAQHGRTGNLEMSAERAQFPSDYAAALEQWGRREEGGCGQR